MPTVLFLRRLNRTLLRTAGWGVVLAMAVIAVVIPCSVFSRYVLRNSPPWSDEVALFSLVWASMLGAAVGLQRGYQVGISFFLDKSPRLVSTLLRLAGFLLTLSFLTLSILFGLSQTLYNLRQLSAAMRVPMAIPYAALPVGFLLMLLITVEDLLAFAFKAPKNGEPAPGPQGAG